jgi:diguanylate cyclase (GGDEF)-like protein/PAS domain S-box-containing protein
MNTVPFESSTTQTPTPKKRVPEQLWLIGVTILATLSIALALGLRTYADSRREGVRTLERFETMAKHQSALEWRAIAESSGGVEIPRTLNDLQQAQRDFWNQVETYKALEHSARHLNQLFGDDAADAVIGDLENAAARYQGSVQSTFGRLGGGMRNWALQGLQNGNPDYVRLWDIIVGIKERNLRLADRANTVSAVATVLALLITLLSAVWLMLRLNQISARRAVELEQQRTRTLRESEARFKQLVQNNTDLIAVLEADGVVRYLSPASQPLLGVENAQAEGQDFWGQVLRMPQDQSLQITQLSPNSEPHEVLARHRNGERLELEVRVQNHLENPDLRGIVVNVHDITRRKQLEQELRFQALHDPLTDLPNRRYFAQELEKALANTIHRVAVLFVDLEGIKLANDSFGHDRGDLLLIEASRRVRSCLRAEDTLGRLGGDELVALLPSIHDETSALEVTNRILKALQLPFMLEGQEIFLIPCLGISLGGAESTPSDLVRHAGIAMYQAKRELNPVMFFRHEMGEEAPERLRLESDMRKGLEQDQFMVVYQPKVDLQTGKIRSVEALVRWQHPQRGLVSPAKFIPFAEETGLIEPLGKIVLETACRDAALWHRQGQTLVVAVNLSAVQFRNPNLIAEVQEALLKSGLPAHALELEITESAVLGDINSTIVLLEQLKALGVRLAIDDFGTGYSNLGHLRRFPVDVLKIDQSFIRGNSGFQKPIVEAVLGLAKALELHTVAEGVETPEQMQQLRQMGCDMGQGYYFAKPTSSAAIGEMLLGKVRIPVQSSV